MIENHKKGSTFFTFFQQILLRVDLSWGESVSFIDFVFFFVTCSAFSLSNSIRTIDDGKNKADYSDLCGPCEVFLFFPHSASAAASVDSIRTRWLGILIVGGWWAWRARSPAAVSSRWPTTTTPGTNIEANDQQKVQSPSVLLVVVVIPSSLFSFFFLCMWGKASCRDCVSAVAITRPSPENEMP